MLYYISRRELILIFFVRRRYIQKDLSDFDMQTMDTDIDFVSTGRVLLYLMMVTVSSLPFGKSEYNGDLF